MSGADQAGAVAPAAFGPSRPVVLASGPFEPSRPLVSPAILAIAFVIAGELMLFAGLVFAFWVLRLGAAAWPPPMEPRLPVGVTGANTVVLVLSSVAVMLARRAFERGEGRRLVRGLAGAAGLGAVFLVVQGFEWARLMAFGLTVSSGLYGATFYTIVGLHAAHVVAALGWLTTVLALAAGGRLTRDRGDTLTACALYWHFVVALWPAIYVSVYLA